MKPGWALLFVTAWLRMVPMRPGWALPFVNCVVSLFAWLGSALCDCVVTHRVLDPNETRLGSAVRELRGFAFRQSNFGFVLVIIEQDMLAYSRGAEMG